MTMQVDTATRNALVQAIETELGTAPLLKFWTGSKPANCAAADSGTLIANMTLPSDWLAAPSGGVGAKSGTWNDPVADNGGVIGHYRMYTSGGTCKQQGTCGMAGSGADMIVDNTTVVAGQSVTVTAYQITAGNV